MDGQTHHHHLSTYHFRFNSAFCSRHATATKPFWTLRATPFRCGRFLLFLLPPLRSCVLLVHVWFYLYFTIRSFRSFVIPPYTCHFLYLHIYDFFSRSIYPAFHYYHLLPTTYHHAFYCCFHGSAHLIRYYYRSFSPVSTCSISHYCYHTTTTYPPCCTHTPWVSGFFCTCVRFAWFYLQHMPPPCILPFWGWDYWLPPHTCRFCCLRLVLPPPHTAPFLVSLIPARLYLRYYYTPPFIWGWFHLRTITAPPRFCLFAAAPLVYHAPTRCCRYRLPAHARLITTCNCTTPPRRIRFCFLFCVLYYALVRSLPAVISSTGPFSHCHHGQQLFTLPLTAPPRIPHNSPPTLYVLLFSPLPVTVSCTLPSPKLHPTVPFFFVYLLYLQTRSSLPACTPAYHTCLPVTMHTAHGTEHFLSPPPSYYTTYLPTHYCHYTWVLLPALPPHTPPPTYYYLPTPGGGHFLGIVLLPAWAGGTVFRDCSHTYTPGAGYTPGFSSCLSHTPFPMLLYPHATTTHATNFVTHSLLHREGGGSTYYLPVPHAFHHLPVHTACLPVHHHVPAGLFLLGGCRFGRRRYLPAHDVHAFLPCLFLFAFLEDSLLPLNTPLCYVLYHSLSLMSHFLPVPLSPSPN